MDEDCLVDASLLGLLLYIKDEESDVKVFLRQKQ